MVDLRTSNILPIIKNHLVTKSKDSGQQMYGNALKRKTLTNDEGFLSNRFVYFF